MNSSATIKAIFLCSIIVFFSSCELNIGPENISSPTLTTDAAENISGSTATLGGNIITTGGESLDTRGICWGFNPNPTINDNYEPADGDSTGSFKIALKDLKPNTTYHARAYARNANEQAYGNDIEFTTDVAVKFEVSIANRITSTRVSLSGGVYDLAVPAGEKGFVLGINPNPTVGDIKLENGVGEGKIGVYMISLIPNTTYYARPFSFIDLEYVYGEDISFKTTGYFGPAGGYVFYDKGEKTNGWRYLEASPQVIEDVKWGCSGNLISETLPALGSGLDNSIRINQLCNETDCGAKISINHQQGAFSDYFLPSQEEAKWLMRSFVGISPSSFPASIWTSTEVTVVDAISLYWSNNVLKEVATGKNAEIDVIPIRRY